ncbi:hypothetical protein C0Z16_34875 [Paraburkholderia rhynchosiae]|uniref:Uncharacterized protein n=1 Tax=Paraburkholderia rhynchosiae TaxID=487049 RepID=A0ABX4UTV6_9BURK|nr:hypothetical protein C0Z16_34875 [Paraburkholderia rhynchosiae]
MSSIYRHVSNVPLRPHSEVRQTRTVVAVESRRVLPESTLSGRLLVAKMQRQDLGVKQTFAGNPPSRKT